MEKSTADDATTEVAIETSLERNSDKQEEDFEEAISRPILILGPEEIEAQVWSRACPILKVSVALEIELFFFAACVFIPVIFLLLYNMIIKNFDR